MEEWEQAQFGQAVEDLKTAKTRDEFKAIMAKAKTPEQKQELTPLVKARIAELAEVKDGQLAKVS
jgi:Spy/CpxP family protein refolding chaperone